jgi:uncharacterized phage protein gp47/JayE
VAELMGLNIFNLPGLESLVGSARAAMKAALPGTNAYIWPNNTYPTAKSFGGMIWSAYQRLDYVGRQTFALFAENQYLDNHGAELGLPRKLATAASGNVIVTVTDVASVSVGAVFVRGDGAIFAATASSSSTGAGAITIPVSGPSGAYANTGAGTPMDIASGVSGAGAAGATAAVDGAGLAGAADVEPDGLPRSRDLATYRGRILFRKANPAQGGAPSDYVTWALGVAGVTRVFVERRWNGPGTVRVFPIFDDLFADAGGIADAGHIATVNAALQLLTPAGCDLTVVAPTAQVIDVFISGLNPNSDAVKASIAAELADAFRRLGAVSGSDTPFPGMDYLATPQTFPALYIEQAVANAAGIVSADVTASDVTIPAGFLPVLGTIHYS